MRRGRGSDVVVASLGAGATVACAPDPGSRRTTTSDDDSLLVRRGGRHGTVASCWLDFRLGEGGGVWQSVFHFSFLPSILFSDSPIDDNAVACALFYMTASTALTLYNKFLFTRKGLKFPLLVTCAHQVRCRLLVSRPTDAAMP